MIRIALLTLCFVTVAHAQTTGSYLLPRKTSTGVKNETVTPSNSTLWGINGSGNLVQLPQSNFAASSHTHAWSGITGKPQVITDITALTTTGFGLDLLAAADAAALHTKAGLGTIATQNANNVTITGGSITGATIAAMAAYKVGTSDPGIDTINSNEAGIGWANGKFTLQTPVGAMQFYTAGSPAEAVMYWAGTFNVASLEAASITGELSGALITSGIIPSTVMNASMTVPFNGWVDDSTHAGSIGGLTYGNTGPNGANEATTPGVYIAAIEVVDNTDDINRLAGRIKTPAQLNLATKVTAPSTASSTGVVGQWAVDTSYFYVCVATNTWKRVALSTW